MMFSVEGKVVLITGTRTGIGKTLLEGFRERGAIVYGAEKKNCDVREQRQVDSFVNRIVEEQGRIHVLINCAGTIEEDVIDTNLLAVEYLCRSVSRHMMHGAAIINITSIASFFGMTENVKYGMAKGGLRILTKCLAIDLSPIRVNNLCPGYFKTKMTEKSYASEVEKDKRECRIIMKRFGVPKELLGAAIFLASEASSYITGTDIVVDGGFSAYGI